MTDRDLIERAADAVTGGVLSRLATDVLGHAQPSTLFRWRARGRVSDELTRRVLRALVRHPELADWLAEPPPSR